MLADIESVQTVAPGANFQAAGVTGNIVYVPCIPHEEKVQVCGREESISHLCDAPVITTAMQEAAQAYPELQDQYQRKNSCIDTSGSCTPLADKMGDSSLRTELDAINAQSNISLADKTKFHFSVTNNSMETQRDDLAAVTKNGFIRNIVSQHLLFRSQKDRKFHEHAEGIALVNAEEASKERAETSRVIEILEVMKSKFQAKKDTDSLRNVDLFLALNRNQELGLENMACDFKKMADFDRETENKMPAINKGAQVAALNYSGKVDTEGSTSTHKNSTLKDPQLDFTKTPPLVNSDISGKMVEGSKTAKKIMGFSAKDLDEALHPFGPNLENFGNQAINDSVEVDLFHRVHLKYEQKAASGALDKAAIDLRSLK